MLSDATATAKGKSAIILLDFQNEFAVPGGKMHNAVAKVMEENDMMHKVEQVVETAREWGALVIHCPRILKKRTQTSVMFLNKRSSHLQNGTRGSEIVDIDGLKPVDSDIVLKERTCSSALKGTNLSSIMEENKIQNAILVGFLSERSVVETAIGLSDEFPELNIIACNDGTASTKEKHAGAMETTLPAIGVNVLSCKEAIDVIETGVFHPSKEFYRQKSNYEDIGTTIQFNIFQLASILGGSGVLISPEILVSVFTYGRSKSSNKNNTDDPCCSFSLEDIYSFVSDLCIEEENIPIQALKAVAINIASVLNFFGGLLLIIGLFPTHRIGALLSSMCYVTASGQSTIRGPIKEWKDMINVQDSVRYFKESIRMNAESYSNEKRATLLKIGFLSAPDNGHFVKQMQYIEEVIYSGNASVLSKTELEMLLMRELGTKYSSRILDYVLSNVSKRNSHAISPAEFHQFISTDNKHDNLSRVWFLFNHTILHLGYLMGLCFFVASSLSIINWCLREAGRDNNQYFSVAIIWLFLVGTLHFSTMSYRQVRDAYDAKERVRGFIDDCIRYSQFYNRDHEIWTQFNKTKSISVKNFHLLLEFSDIILQEDEIAELMQAINPDGGGFITKEELNNYLSE
mmetsp:Transcript_32828/g.55832  ORF Transcript_32828/g.55832 Transcript_32828/m.55832 type:complete len:630 (+) Transcript_32828:149-2038(+)